MKTRLLTLAGCIIGSQYFSHGALADGRSWQLKQLFSPSQVQVQMETRGRVMIYQGLRDTDVRRAMDEQFERIESMMFTGTVLTDDRGEPLIDPVTGEQLVESDDC